VRTDAAGSLPTAAAGDPGDGRETASPDDEAAEGVHALVLVTEWPEFREVDFVQIKQRMREPVLVDTRNFLNPELLVSLGFKYEGIGVRQ
jgi:UDPglucose 6-dehydrogenase